ncbi:MAG: hypothetical protein AAGK78_13640 [Planctomycetota bacterium]
MKTSTMAARVRRAGVSLTLCLALVLSVGVTSGCFTQQVKVGAGASGGTSIEHRQWFALWGLIPITEIDPEASIGDAQNYTVETGFTPVDVVIGIFTGIVTIQPKTVTIKK